MHQPQKRRSLRKRRGSGSMPFLVACALTLFSMAPMSLAGPGVGDRSFAATAKAHAQFYFGVMLAGGYGVPQDPAKAAIWVRKAAEQGVALAQNYLAVMYLVGHGVPQDRAAYIAWTRKAAERGLALAQARLGYAYTTGDAIAQDNRAAMGWNLKAAEQGIPAAAATIGLGYLTQTGGSVDMVRAYQWLNLALRLAEEEIQRDRSEIMRSNYLFIRKQCRELESVLTPDQIRQAQALEREWRTTQGR